jgi:uncharacterized membrane protein
VHYPHALLASATFWDVASLWMPRLSVVGFHCLWLGLVASAIAVATGLWDFARLPERPAVMRTANLQLAAMLGALSFYGAALYLRLRAETSEPAALACSAFGLVILLGGSYFGGELVYGHGVGVRDRSSHAGGARSTTRADEAS